MPLAELLQQLDPRPEVRGSRFERLCRRFLRRAPEQRRRVDARRGRPLRRTYHLCVALANKPPVSANGRAGRKPGPRGTATEKYRRDLGIYGARLNGRSAAALAREHGLSERQVREVVRHMRDAAEPPHASPEEVVKRVLAAMEDALAEMARAAYGLSGAARLRALGTYLRALQTYFRVLQKAGRVPEPRRASVERDVERMVETVLDVFRRHEVPIEAQREIHDLLVGRGRPEAG